MSATQTNTQEHKLYPGSIQAQRVIAKLPVTLLNWSRTTAPQTHESPWLVGTAPTKQTTDGRLLDNSTDANASGECGKMRHHKAARPDTTESPAPPPDSIQWQ